MLNKKPSRAKANTSGSTTSARSTVSGPARKQRAADVIDALTRKAAGTDPLAAAVPVNANKAGEYGRGRG